jgi:hypothetical protein
MTATREAVCRWCGGTIIKDDVFENEWLHMRSRDFWNCHGDCPEPAPEKRENE